MTEEEAVTKKCCGPPAVATSTYYRAGAPVEAPALCIGSACMAWRGAPSAAFRSMAEAEFRNTGKRLSPGSDEIEGHCGLAGAPQ